MSEDRPLFVARPADITTLKQHFDAAVSGSPRFVRLASDFGGGRRALAGELIRTLRSTPEDPLLWRVAAADQETGVQWLLRMYAGLVASVAGDAMRRGKVELILNGQLPTQTRRVQGWYQQFVTSLKEAKVDAQTGQVQLRVPQDNPLIGLVEIVLGISRKMPVVLELQAPWMVHSVLTAQFLEALLSEARSSNARLLVLAFDEPAGEVRDNSFPAPLLDFYQRRADEITSFDLTPWGEAEVAAYLDTKGLKGDAARIADIAHGRPGFIAELVDILHESGKLSGDLSGMTLASLTPMEVDEDDLTVPDAPPAEGQRKHATAADAPRVAHIAALLGQVFPASLVAEMGGFERESIDDLLDAMPELFEEVQYSDQMSTWIYKFKRGCWREGILEMNSGEEGKGLTRGVAMFMERFLVPRGQSFMVRTSRLWAEGGSPQRAATMRAIALTNDVADSWSMAYEMMRYFDEVAWNDAMRRSILTTLLDHLVSTGPIPQAEQVHTEATAWATEKGDRELQAWLLLTGSKLDARRQDFFRARDRARDAITMFEALEAPHRVAEVWAHIASVELQDSRHAEALEAANKALELGSREQDGKKIVQPHIFAQTEIVRGVVARQAKNFEEAITHFRQANEVAGNTGHGSIALEAGLALGEALAASNQTEQAREVLRRVFTATRQVGAVMRERAAAQMLAQIEGQMRNFADALQLSQRVLQISQQTNFEVALPYDLYNVGFFMLAQNKGAEALPFLEQSYNKVKGQESHPILKDLNYYLGMAALQAGKLDVGRSALERSLKPLQAARDARKLVGALSQLAALDHRGGKTDRARKLLTDAINIARDAELKDEKRELKRQLESLGGAAT